MKIVLLGMNHRTAPVDVREHFASDEPGALLQKLVDRPEIVEATLLSTCNRVEVVVTTENPDGAKYALYEFFARDLANGEGPAAGALEELTYLRQGREAVEHVFRVASSIDRSKMPIARRPRRASLEPSSHVSFKGPSRRPNVSRTKRGSRSAPYP